MRLIFVRHGFADHNEGFLREGESAYRSFAYRYSHLTQLGQQQIKAAVIPTPDLVFSSPLVRCIETTRILIGDNPTIRLHDGLIETQGAFPCNWRESVEEISSKYHHVDVSDLSEFYEPQIDTESPEEMVSRAEKALENIIDVAKKEEACTVLIVSHCDWLEAVFGRKFENGEVYITHV